MGLPKLVSPRASWTSRRLDVIEQLKHVVLAYAIPVTVLRDVETSDRNWNPFSWSLPTVRNVEVDWDKVRNEARTACVKDMFDIRDAPTARCRDIAYDMSYKISRNRPINANSHMMRVQARIRLLSINRWVVTDHDRCVALHT